MLTFAGVVPAGFVLAGVGVDQCLSQQRAEVGGTVKASDHAVDTVRKTPLTNWDAANVLKILQDYCFAAGTPVVVPGGSKRIEELQPGDLVYSRPEGDPDGKNTVQPVERVFRLFAPIVEVHVGLRVIETTAEHPFWVEGYGWRAARELLAGDVLLGYHHEGSVVTDVQSTDQHAAVFNLRVANDHTYFVGSPSWGFSVWVHNTYTAVKRGDNPGRPGEQLLQVFRPDGSGVIYKWNGTEWVFSHFAENLF